MRALPLFLAFAASVAAMSVVDEAPRTGEAKSPNGRWSAHFRQTAPDAASGNYGEVTVYRDTRKLLTHTLPRLVARAAWSPDSRYCVFTTVNAQGHSPTYFTAYVFRISDHSFRRLDDLIGGVTDPEFTFEPPDIVVMQVLDTRSETSQSKQVRASLHKIANKLLHDNET